MTKFNSTRFFPIFDPDPKARLDEVFGQGGIEENQTPFMAWGKVDFLGNLE